MLETLANQTKQIVLIFFWTRAHTYTFSSVLFAASSPRSSFLKILRIGRIRAGFMQDVRSLLLTGSCLSSCLRKSFSACFITKSCKSQKETYSEPVSVWNVHQARVTTQSQLLRITRCFQVSNKQVWQFGRIARPGALGAFSAQTLGLSSASTLYMISRRHWAATEQSVLLQKHQ